MKRGSTTVILQRFGPLLGLLILCAVLGALTAQLRAAGRIEALRIELAAASVRLEASAMQGADRLKLLEESEVRLRAAFDSLAGETLSTASAGRV